MSYETLEVEVENGQVRACGNERLPVKARALLTIIEPALREAPTGRRTMGDALRELAQLGSEGPSDLSTNRAHLDDLGR